ncbi:alpha/beta fold hydrolase [Mycobacterium tuberculosis]|uniref:alpha/beta fold hydrolase n=1 Tax=Mycobacterium tuberculosis TaxID=1773 RepID=UPI0022351AEA|nr:alpha/beta hydrolase [Mycobacterium tuberculosis]
MAALVAGLSRRGRPAACRRRDRDAGGPAGALGPYRATMRNTRAPADYADLNRLWTEAPKLPVLYLHGHDDGCATSAFTHWTARVLPAGSEVAVVEHAGHFLQLEQPDKIAELIVAFIGSPG